MSNKSILQRLLVEIDEYNDYKIDRDGFANRFINSIEALESIPYLVIQESRDWQYRIETEGYFVEEGFESVSDNIIPHLKSWVNELITKYN
ncbi:hypothetical protein [Shewanella sp. ENK2]|uniref:hypothetical protein n=1 Tax=Shewanella sp. ENK2 TaxID=2775245 RepID=UPI0037486B39